MDENVQKTNVPTPSEPEMQETAEVSEAVESSESATQPTSEAAVENESGTEQNDTTVPDWENEKKSLAGRISKYEKELNEYRDKVKLLEALDSAAATDPEFMKMANKKLVEQGLLDASVLEQLEERGVSNQPGAVKNAVENPAVLENPAVKWAEQKMREERQKKEQFFVDFEEKHPDLKEGEEKVIRANRSAIGAIANKRIAEGVSQADAYEYAYGLVMNPSQIAEKAKLEGIAQAQSGLPTEGAASGGSADSTGGITLTPEQKEAARMFGVSEEAYAKRLSE